MKTPSITTIKKYLSSLKKLKRKYVTSEIFSNVIGVYPDVLNETFSYFDPMVNLDFSYNILDLIPMMENYIEEYENSRDKSSAPKHIITRKKMVEFSSINDFIFKKMTDSGGIVDRNVVLKTEDLKILRKLINEELAKRKKTK